LELCLAGAKAVYSVDCNPAQNALLELKQVAIRRLGYEDFWMLFGRGKHADFATIFDRELAPFLSQNSLRFWRSRMQYFKEGLYYQGGMGKAVWALQTGLKLLGLGGAMKRLCEAPTVEAQRKVWESTWVVRALRTAPELMLSLVADMIALLLFNRITLWFGCGVPLKQYQLIKKDGVHMSTYAARTLNGVAQHSSLSKDNYFYFNCLMGQYTKDNCPKYLTREGFEQLKEGAVDALHIVNAFFLPTLQARTYTKVILMDHLDWMDLPTMRKVAQALGRQLATGGRVIWRSAALQPPYAKLIQEAGFEVRCLQRADREAYMDRVNMYSSFYLAIKK
jgi:betaine lipid synthase